MSFSIEQIDQVGRTAFIVSHWRYWETIENNNPLFDDTISKCFLHPATEELARQMRSQLSLVRSGMIYRTHYFDQAINNKIKEGVRQILILGSGLDTRPLRLAHPGVSFFEVDRKAVLDFKIKTLESEGVTYPGLCVKKDYGNEVIWKDLSDLGLQEKKPVFILWEGNIFYLTQVFFEKFLGLLLQQFSSMTLCFDYFTKAVIEEKTAFKDMNDLAKRFRLMNAPWFNGLDKASDLTTKFDLEIIDDVDALSYKKSLPNRTEEVSPSIELYRFCTLKNKIA